MRAAAILCAVAALGVAGCDSLPGRPNPADRYVHPAKVSDFATLYAQNCTGCHGDAARPGGSIALTDPVYLALADDAAIRTATAQGVKGTSMPAFAVSAGGTLTDAQIDILVRGIRSTWGKPNALAGGAPPYAAPLGNASAGAAVYATYCASCHGDGGSGGAKGGSVIDGSYLALISDQGLRTVVLAGRPALGMPDYRSYVQGRAMTSEEVSDVVAWLASKRAPFPGRPYARAEGDQ